MALGSDDGDREHKRYWLAHWPFVVALVANIAITAVFYTAVRDRDQALLDAEVDRRARIYAAAIQSGVDRSLAVLDSLVGLYATQDVIDRATFRAFVEAGSLLRPDVQALEWVPRVAHAEREGYESRARSTWRGDFHFTERDPAGEMRPATERAEYLPVLYVEPLTGNEAAVGFDLASNSTRRAAAEKARDTGQKVMTGRITLVQESGAQHAVLVFAPVYAVNQPIYTVSQRREALAGYVLGVFRLGAMIDAYLAGATLEGAHLAVYDTQADGDQSLLYRSSPELPDQLDDGLGARIALQVPGREWSAVFAPSPELSATYGPSRAGELLAGGVLYTAIMVVFLGLYFFRHTRTLESAVARQTLQHQVAKEAAEAANRAKSQFLITMSHELRTPLGSVIGFARLLAKNRDGNLTPNQLSFLSRIEANGKHILVLIDRILDLGRIEEQRIELQLAPVDVAALVHEVTSELESQVREDRVKLIYGLPRAAAMLETDAFRLKQILINLIGNALELTPRGSVTIAVRTAGEDLRPTRIDIIDTGIGIPRDRLEAILEAFEQAESGPSLRYDGPGLGLAICHSLCELLGYRLEIESEVGRGSTFSVCLEPSPGEEPQVGDEAERDEPALGERAS